MMNVLVNILLLGVKIATLFFISSLSLVASTTDSALDLFCIFIVWSTNQIVKWRLASVERRFPVGYRRMKPLGILVFSVIMVISFLQILQESVQKLMQGGDPESLVKLPSVAIGAMMANVVIKGVIGRFCRGIHTAQKQTLVQGRYSLLTSTFSTDESAWLTIDEYS